MSHQRTGLRGAAAIIERIASARRWRRLNAMSRSMSNRDLMDIGLARDDFGFVRKLPSDWS